MSRKTPEGNLLAWRLSLDPTAYGDGVVPFVIDWGETVSPAVTSVQGCVLERITLRHPSAPDVNRRLVALQLALRAEQAALPEITIEVMTPNGLKSLT